MSRFKMVGRFGTVHAGLGIGALVLAASAAIGLSPLALAAASVEVTTYHGDPQRTGWNEQETILTVANVGAAGFGLLYSVPLDEQVDAQPLIVTGQTITGVKGTHTVVYVATENNTVYAIDAASGTVLRSRNLGTPVPMPFGCTNNSATVGIGSTPVIDTSSKTLYVITDNYDSGSGQAAFYLHALALGSLADKAGSPVKVQASHKLSDGTVYNFTPASSRQRAALLNVNGNVYAAFASYCDYAGPTSRGWLLGWNATSLKPLAAAELTNQFTPTQAPDNFFLSSIWMSGYGVAADSSGNLFFVTGNSAYWAGGSVPFSVQNLAESVVKVSSNLQAVTSYFTPQNLASLDAGDADFGSGGVIVLPNQKGKFPHLAVAAGKDGNMYFLNRDSLGGFTPTGPDKVLGTYPIGGCWCGPSYFVGADNVPRVVSSGGWNIITWKLQTSTPVSLVQDQYSANVYPDGYTNQDPGLFTTISSNKTKAGTAIIWTVARPAFSNPTDWNITLNAFDAANMTTPIYTGTVGTWVNSQANANIVPTVANGQVYVASYKNLAIFGLGAPTPSAQPGSGAVPVAISGNQLYGTAQAVNGASLSLKTRNGAMVAVDMSLAAQTHKSAVVRVGRTLLVQGRYGADGTLHADSIQRAKGSPKSWGPDR